MLPLLRRKLFTVSSYSHCNCPSFIILQFGIMFPLFFWNLFTISCYIRCSCTTIIILYIRFMIPLLWRNNLSFTCKSHSNSPATRSNIRVMIIFLIRHLSFIICLYHCHSKINIIFTFLEFRILILFILPNFWNYYSIIPQIITYCIPIFIPLTFISLYILWYLSLFNYFILLLILLILYLFST